LMPESAINLCGKVNLSGKWFLVEEVFEAIEKPAC